MKRKKLKIKRGTIEFTPAKKEFIQRLDHALRLIAKLAAMNPYKEKK